MDDFGWMKVVFDWRVMIGMVFMIDWVKKFCELVKYRFRTGYNHSDIPRAFLDHVYM